MKCPHCSVAFRSQTESYRIGHDSFGNWVLSKKQCPNCGKLILKLECSNPTTLRGDGPKSTARLVQPKVANRPPLPKEVPDEFSEDYKEACLVLPDSPKASAALSRRCLQHLLREVAKVKPRNLDSEIQRVLTSGDLPSYLAEGLDAVRWNGNSLLTRLKVSAQARLYPLSPARQNGI